VKKQYVLIPLLCSISGCTLAFDIGESLNRATSNIANHPNVLWSSAEPASAPAATSEPHAIPKEEAK
jgi:hypothetical protein